MTPNGVTILQTSPAVSLARAAFEAAAVDCPVVTKTTRHTAIATRMGLVQRSSIGQTPMLRRDQATRHDYVRRRHNADSEGVPRLLCFFAAAQARRATSVPNVIGGCSTFAGSILPMVRLLGSVVKLSQFQEGTGFPGYSLPPIRTNIV